jgi:hypothetical protein
VQTDAEYSSAQPRSGSLEKGVFLTEIGLVEYIRNPERLNSLVRLPCIYHVTGLQNDWKTIQAIIEADYRLYGNDVVESNEQKHA